MILGYALTGFIAAVIVFLPRYLHHLPLQMTWHSPVWILGVGALAMLVQRFSFARKGEDSIYEGLSDLLHSIHSPHDSAPIHRWFIRGVFSFLLTLFGGCAGPEGAAMEWVQGIHAKWGARSSRWFEQKRRTDAAASMSAAIAAAFGAPFAGVLLPIELGIGGRTAASVLSSLSAFLTIRFLLSLYSIELFDVSGVLSGFHFATWREWVGVAMIASVGGVVGVGVISFIVYTQESLRNLFQTQLWTRVLVGALLLALLFVIHRPLYDSSQLVLEQVLWIRHTPLQVVYLFLIQLLVLAFVLAGFGTLGVFWPIFLVGGLFGFSLNQYVFGDISDFSAAAGLVGSVTFFGAILGAPLTGTLLAFEMTQNIQIILPCLIAGFIGQSCRRKFLLKTLTEKQLDLRGFSLKGGRLLSVLESIPVREAMVTDFDWVEEQEAVSNLRARIDKSRYPFLPVVNAQGMFKGMLTVDLISETSESLLKLMEVKDLLYRSETRTPVVKATESLSSVVEVFYDKPCIPVLGEDGKVIGLLFSFNLRLAYEREMTRRSFLSFN